MISVYYDFDPGCWMLLPTIRLEGSGDAALLSLEILCFSVGVVWSSYPH